MAFIKIMTIIIISISALAFILDSSKYIGIYLSSKPIANKQIMLEIIIFNFLLISLFLLTKNSGNLDFMYFRF